MGGHRFDGFSKLTNNVDPEDKEKMDILIRIETMPQGGRQFDETGRDIDASAKEGLWLNFRFIRMILQKPVWGYWQSADDFTRPMAKFWSKLNASHSPPIM